MKMFWFIPTHGDGRYLGTAEGGRLLDFNYLRQVALAADAQGFYGVLFPTGRSCEDAWVVASTLIPETSRLRFLVALRPGLVSPTLAARMCATFDRLSRGRLQLRHLPDHRLWAAHAHPCRKLAGQTHSHSGGRVSAARSAGSLIYRASVCS